MKKRYLIWTIGYGLEHLKEAEFMFNSLIHFGTIQKDNLLAIINEDVHFSYNNILKLNQPFQYKLKLDLLSELKQYDADYFIFLDSDSFCRRKFDVDLLLNKIGDSKIYLSATADLINQRHLINEKIKNWHGINDDDINIIKEIGYKQFNAGSAGFFIINTKYIDLILSTLNEIRNYYQTYKFSQHFQYYNDELELAFLFNKLNPNSICEEYEIAKTFIYNGNISYVYEDKNSKFSCHNWFTCEPYKDLFPSIVHSPSSCKIIMKRFNFLNIKLKKDPQLSICLFSKKRLSQVKQSVPHTLSLMRENDELIYIDYDDPDNSSEYVNLINDKRLKVIKVKDCPFWNGAHARNIALKYIKNDIIIMMDIDNLISKEVFDQCIEVTPQEYYILNQSGSNKAGFLCTYKENFLAVNGYEEAIVGYGWEDSQIKIAFQKYGLKEKISKCENTMIYLTEGGTRITDNDNKVDAWSTNKEICKILDTRHPYKSNINRNWGRL